MEDAWHSKCSSTWSTTPPTIVPQPSLPPAPPLAPASSSLSSQMDKNPRNLFLPFIVQGTNFESRPAIQEQPGFHALNIDFSKSGKTEMGNSFLAMLSANPNNFLGDFSQLAKLQANVGSIAISSSGTGTQVTSIPSMLSKSTNSNIWNVEKTEFANPRPSSISSSTRTPAVYNSIPVARSDFHVSASSKPVPYNVSQSIDVGKSSIERSRSCNYKSGKNNQMHALDIQTTQKMPANGDSSIRNHDTISARVRPRVICMNTAGEMFLSELGLLGVICSCHNLPMSVAKFSEHSGSSANPGEVVRLENGMTVAKWRKLCFGNNAPDDCEGWGWSDGPSIENGFLGSRGSTLPVFPQNPRTVGPHQTFVGLGKSGDPLTLYTKAPCTEVRQVVERQSSYKMSDSIYQNRLEGEDFTIPSQSHVSVLAKNHTMHAKDRPDCLSTEASCATPNKGEQNVWSPLVINSNHCNRKLGNSSLLHAHLDSKTPICKSSSSRNSFRSEAFTSAKKSNSSIMDLRLGQPSQAHTSLSSLSTPLSRLPFGAACNSQKSEINLPQTGQTGFPMETKKPMIGLCCTSSEPSLCDRGPSKLAVESNKKFSQVEPTVVNGNITKYSQILFLSQLNSERSSTSQSATIVDDSKYYIVDSGSVKCNHSEDKNGKSGENQKNSFLDGSSLSTDLDKGKQLKYFDIRYPEIVKSNHTVHNKQEVDARFPMPATSTQNLYDGSSRDDRRYSLHFNQPISKLQAGPVSVNFNQYGRVPFGRNMDQCDPAANSSMSPISYPSVKPSAPKSGTPVDITSSNSIYISETSAQAHSKSINDDNMNFLHLGHMIQLSKQVHPTSCLEVSSRYQRLCCHSGIDLQRNVCKGDLTASEVLKQGIYGDVQQSASEFTTRSSKSYINCIAGNGAAKLPAKIGRIGQDEYCKCRTLEHRISQCYNDVSPCHVCCADEHPCLRLGKISTCSSHSLKQILDQKDQSVSFHRKCCCSVLSEHLTGCCCMGSFSPSNPVNRQKTCGKVIINHITQGCDDIHRSQDNQSVDLCECAKKHYIMKNDCRTGLWRDVPSKKIGQSDATSVDKPVQGLEVSGGTDYQLPECEGTEQELNSVNEQQISNVCSGSSVPAVTVASVKVNKVNYCATNVEDNKTLYDLVADDRSGDEKCGSCDDDVELNIQESEEESADNGKKDPDNFSYPLPSQTSDDLIKVLRLDGSFNQKKLRNQMQFHSIDQENSKKRKVWKEDKAKKQMNINKLDVTVPNSGMHPINSESSHCISHVNWEFSSSDKSEAPSQAKTVVQKPSLKRKCSSLSSVEPFSLTAEDHNKNLDFEKVQSNNKDQSLRTLEVSSLMEKVTVPEENQLALEEDIHLDSEKPPKYMSLSCIGKSINHDKEIVNKKVKPVVCGKSGIISNDGLCGQKKPPKFFSLSLIMKKSKRCDANEYGAKDKKLSTSENRKMLLKENNGCCNELSSSKVKYINEDFNQDETDPLDMIPDLPEHTDGLSMIAKETDRGNNIGEEALLHQKNKIFQTRSVYREVRKCSLSKILGKDKHGTKLSYTLNSGTRSSTVNGIGDQPKASPSTSTINSLVDTHFGKRCLNNQDHADELSQDNTTRSNNSQKCQPLSSSSNAFCCVCGSSNKEELNCILECNRCLIRVHQACYGVSKVPRGHWFCRPCKTNTQNTVCVLCGYEGGAMTKAVKSQTIVKSLLKAWNFGTFMKSVSSSGTIDCEYEQTHFIIEASKCTNSSSVTAARSGCSEVFPEVAVSENPVNDMMPRGLQFYNSITAGILDPSIAQWVHMVCGLWTPGTRCPNVDTMSSFDVSGASATGKNTVCSMCNRPGGCCIQCRVLKCSMYFHPWCAHQKGLLQSEIEGDDDEKVGFYGRCLLHEDRDDLNVDTGPTNSQIGSPKEYGSCARTESFNGRKSEEVFKPNHRRPPSNDNGGCNVSQEQINAWLHINGQKSCTRAVVKPACSDVESDFRKEYFRYKQSKAWKHLVVYKSGIHALGLYTSQLIAHGAMVVEYVGEIVGLRVADKREVEYQSCRRLQYKSACYFFRIDKEHIIDATRKGGIARFVNHSCQPNCVAKVISVRNEKKVVFFAIRDINPGEEITYDYHFNREDEGEKIPCYCNSKQCRRYLN